jgi:hypothetical protein
MAHRGKGGQSGKKAGSIIDEPTDLPSKTGKSAKARKPKKQSRGK